MRFGRKAKAVILSALALFGVGTTAIATAAWFTLRNQSPELNMKTASPDLAIDNNNVTGYKINPTLGTDGFPDYNSNTVAHKKGSGSTYGTTNNNQANADLNFDVPSDGLGYYLVKKNPSDTYKYKYDGNSYAWKFDEFTDGDIHYVVLKNISMGITDSFIVRNYSYDISNYKTVNTKVAIQKDNGNFSIDAETYEIKAGAAGTYNLWFNKDTKKLTLEEQLVVSNQNVASLQASRKELKNANSYTITVYYAISTSYTVKAHPNTGDGWSSEITMTKQSYSYRDKPVYSASITVSNATFWEIQFQLWDGGTWKSEQLALNNTGTNYSDLNNKIWWDGGGTTRDNFYDSTAGLLYDGWVIVGYSSNSASSFYGKSWNASGAIRLESDAGNLGKVVVDLRAGDKFKMAYMKGANVTNEDYSYYIDNDSTKGTRMEVYGGSVDSYFKTDSDLNCVVKDGISLHCTIYFTNAKKINVNITSSLIIKAAKFDITGAYVGVESTNAGSKSVLLGGTVTKVEINALSLAIPAGYSRESTNDVFTTSACTVSVGASFTADTNPKTVYIKVVENPITIYLTAYFSDTASGSNGSIDNTRSMTLNTQFGATTVISEGDLHTLWSGTYSDNLTYGDEGTKYSYGRIETSTHTSAISTGTIANNTTLYVRYVRVTHTITLTPSYFEPNGTNHLSFTIQGSQTEGLLDNNDFTTSKTFDNCEYKDHTNGIWYVFHRADSNWYTDVNCTTTPTNKIRANTTLYAKMVAYPLTTFYIDADYPGWNNCYIHMWGTLSGLDSAMNNSLTAKAIATDTYNKVYRVSIPTMDITGFLLHAGDGTGKQTVDITPSSMTGSSSKYCRIAGDTESARTATFTDYKSTSATNVWVQKYSGGVWTNITGTSGTDGQLSYGDGQGNDYILETGLQLTNNDIIRVYNVGSERAYGYAQYVTGNKDKHTYVASNTVSISGDSIKISRLGSDTATARFNFYVTHAGELSIAMVPDYGNGYYIMKYNSTDKTENFIGAIKMDSADYSATYEGWYCGNTSEKIFIRSYLDAVDRICTSLTTASETYATMKTDSGDDQYCITFKNTGHYSIRVTGQIVEIKSYTVDDFFALNRLDSSLVTGTDTAKQQEIWRQKTAIVMEIPFTANNPYSASVNLKVDCSASWIGVRFAVYSSQLADPYTTMHGASKSTYTTSYLTDAHTSTPISDTNSLTISPNSGGTFYAYVLIDYRYTVTAGNLTGGRPEIGLYLQLVQR
ncbi:MAG: hypothetical protein IJS37_00615 [Bacilli bacterium]|nr:hypothetical protein [Bacilli bacterium]